MNFNGQIVAGDLEQLKTVVQSNSSAALGGVSLDSFGGDIAEAEKLERYLFALRPDMAAAVWKDRVCASACFLLFACAPIRLTHISARIGIHSVRNATNNVEDLSSYATDTWFARRLKECSVRGHPSVGLTKHRHQQFVFGLLGGVQIADHGFDRRDAARCLPKRDWLVRRVRTPSASRVPAPPTSIRKARSAASRTIRTCTA